MANKLGWFAVRSAREEAVEGLKAAAGCAPADAFPVLFSVAESDRWTSFSILGWEIAHAFDWAQGVSRLVGTTTVAFFVLEECWSWALFVDGTHVCGMEGFPHRFPRLVGDLSSGSEALGTDASKFQAYCIGDPFGDFDEETASDEQLDLIDEGMQRLDSYRVHPNDEFPPWDEWAHVDFARQLGIQFPDTGDEISICRPERTPRAWDQQRLDAEADQVFLFDPEEWRKQHLPAG